MTKYINRDKAIAYVEEQYRLFKDDEGKQAIVEGCVEALKFTPTADVVEVKHGEWVENQHISQKLGIPVKNEFFFTCSLCGHDSIGKSNYCRECGANMRGDK